MNIAHWLARTALATPDAPALFFGETQVADYASFAAQTFAVAGWLQDQGIKPGDRVAVFMPNTPEYLITLYAIWCVGAAAVPINAKLHSREAAFILENAQASLVFAAPKLSEALEAENITCPIITTPGPMFATARATAPVSGIEPCSSDDLAWVFYTSGTTGQPKGVIITHGMIAAMAMCYEVDVDRVEPGDAALYAAPLSHGAGLYNFMHVRAGARHVFPISGGFEAAEILDLAAHFGAVHMFAAPTMVRRLTASAKSLGWRGDGLETIVYAGGPMYRADILEAVEWFGPVLVQIYGQGECPMGITALSRADVAQRDMPGWESRLDSVGRAQTLVEVQIADEAGVPLPVGARGEIMVRGAMVMPGYWRNPDATQKTLRDGWLMTGDIGSMDAQGYVTLQDRSKDVIITGGSNVYPREVEEVLLTHAQVEEVAVVGQAHAEWGEVVVAFVVGTANAEALDALCLEQIARFKRPKSYVHVAELPKNNYGKVLKTELRAMLSLTAKK